MTITAKIIADSISPDNIRLTTLQLRYPRFIHAEFMTHRTFSRNASSSRAIPVERLIRDVIEDPVYPSFWGANQKGMQAKEECFHKVGIGGKAGTREEMWDRARNDAAYYAQKFADAGYHKQIVNRLLEPFSHINVVVTATEWDNFFALRCHPDAQPEMRILAETIRNEIDSCEPKQISYGQNHPFNWHLPYVGEDEWKNWPQDLRDGGDGYSAEDCRDNLIKLSVARCARVSYFTHEGKPPNITDDLRLYDRLVGSSPLHASPAEHQATPDERAPIYNWKNLRLQGNFRGWIQYRKILEGEMK